MTSKTIVTLFAAAVVGVTLLAGTEHTGSPEQARENMAEDAVGTTRELAEDQKSIEEIDKAIDTLLNEVTPKVSGTARKKRPEQDSPMSEN